MSWDVYMEISTGGPEPATLTEGRNYTYNVSDMFALAFDGYEGLNSTLHGKTGTEAIPTLTKAIRWMEDNPDKCKALNPPNKWGNYEGALQFLRNIVEDCMAHPKATVAVR